MSIVPLQKVFFGYVEMSTVRLNGRYAWSERGAEVGDYVTHVVIRNN